jgi:hypothetical protein
LKKLSAIEDFCASPQDHIWCLKTRKNLASSAQRLGEQRSASTTGLALQRIVGEISLG